MGGAIYLEGAHSNLISKNDLDKASIGLAFGSHDNTVAANSVSGSGGVALTYGAHGNEIKGNAITGGGIGIFASSGNVIVGNDISASPTFGIGVHGSCHFGRSDENALVRNTVRGSAGDGIAVAASDNYPHPCPGPRGNAIIENKVDAGNDDGIDVDSESTVVTKNSTNDNGDLGIEAVPGVIDGGGNRARGNGNPLQCLYVVCS